MKQDVDMRVRTRIEIDSSQNDDAKALPCKLSEMSGFKAMMHYAYL